MHASTPPGDPGADVRNDPTGRHGDVDRNGDLVDELAGLALCANIEQEIRLRGAISATTPELAEQQLRSVRQIVRPWTVNP